MYSSHNLCTAFPFSIGQNSCSLVLGTWRKTWSLPGWQDDLIHSSSSRCVLHGTGEWVQWQKSWKMCLVSKLPPVPSVLYLFRTVCEVKWLSRAESKMKWQSIALLTLIVDRLLSIVLRFVGGIIPGPTCIVFGTPLFSRSIFLGCPIGLSRTCPASVYGGR